jgi:uncharacterized protein YjiS (DUF1127 family)
MLRWEGFMLASNPVKRYPVLDSIVAAFGDWVRKRRQIRQLGQRLDQCVCYEIANLARDAGLSPNDLRRMAKLGPDAAKYVLERMTALHLDAEAIAKNEPATMRDLQRLCSTCASKKQCQFDLLLVPDDPNWWRYCPNAGTLAALQSEAAKAH